MPLYWAMMRSLQVLERRGSSIRALAELNLSGTCEVTIRINAIRRRLALRYQSGPLRGTQTLSVGRGRVEAVWDLDFVGEAMSSLWDEPQLRMGTTQALEQLAGSARTEMLTASVTARRSHRREN